jgi:CheY-like chemotaxis protein
MTTASRFIFQAGSARLPNQSAPVLVVDDAPVDRLIAGEMVSRIIGARVVYAENGVQALAMVDREHPGLVLTDLLMPEMNGLQMVERLRSSHPTLPVVLMTAFGSEEIALEAIRAGATSYVPKRFLDRDLEEVLGRVLQAAAGVNRRQQVLEDLIRFEAEYKLRNDPGLSSSLVELVQEPLAGLRICDDHERLRVAIALEEALANAHYHGNLEVSSELLRQDYKAYRQLAQERRQQAPYRDRRVHVCVRIYPTDATISVEDEGPGFDPSTVPDPTDPANLDRPSGRGLLLIRSFMDEVTHNDKGNRITMVKRRSSPNQA